LKLESGGSKQVEPARRMRRENERRRHASFWPQ
jgi:hypothetical protein